MARKVVVACLCRRRLVATSPAAAKFRLLVVGAKRRRLLVIRLKLSGSAANRLFAAGPKGFVDFARGNGRPPPGGAPRALCRKPKL